MTRSFASEATPALLNAHSTRDRTIGDLFRLEGRTIVVTGGGGSMGLEVARSVVESGGDVICVDQADEPLADGWNRVTTAAKANGCEARYISCNIVEDGAFRHMLELNMVSARFPLRGLVACAGISRGGPAIDLSMDIAKRVFDVNVFGTFACAQAAAQQFRKQNVQGSIVLVASMSAHISNQNVTSSAYNASKAAVLQLSRSLAAEWGNAKDMPVIRVNTISPGYIKTRMTSTDLLDAAVEKHWMEGNMLQRLSEADEYRGAVQYLLSDASSFVTGADIRVDGGHTAW